MLMIDQYENKLREIESIGGKDLNLEEIKEYYRNFETTMNTLDSREAAILSNEIRASLKYRYSLSLEKYQHLIEDIDSFYQLLDLISAPLYEHDPAFKTIIRTAKKELNKLNSNEILGISLKMSLSNKYNARIDQLPKELIDELLPLENSEREMLMIDQYDSQLIEFEMIAIKDLNFEEIKEYCRNLEATMNTLDSEEATILSNETCYSLKYRYSISLGKYQNLIEDIHSFYQLLDLMTGPVNEDDPKFKKILIAAKKEWNKLNSNEILGISLKMSFSNQYNARIDQLPKELIDELLPLENSEREMLMIDQYDSQLIEFEMIAIKDLNFEEIKEYCRNLEATMNTLDSEEAAILSNETCYSLKYRYSISLGKYQNLIEDIDSFYQQIDLMTGPVNEDDPALATILRTAKKEWNKLNSNENIGNSLKMSLCNQYNAGINQLPKELIAKLLPVDFKEKARLMIDSKLIEIESIASKDLNFEEMEEYCRNFEATMNTLDSEEASILPNVTRTSFKYSYRLSLKKYQNLIEDIDSFYQLLDLMTAPAYEDDPALETILITAEQKLNKLQVNNYLGISLKMSLSKQFKARLDQLVKEVIDRLLPVEYRDSIDLITKTLAEPELYTLPSLIMWRETAKKKIEKLQKVQVFPQLIAKGITDIYRDLIKRLKAEILKLRTYPIPEPWCSLLMREKLTYMIQGEFIFFIHPQINEDMKPLTVSDRDLLPGGLTRDVYNKRLDRIKKESITAKEEMEISDDRDKRNKLSWIQYRHKENENKVNFAFTELSLLYRDGRTLEYLVNKNEDDALLKEIYDTLLRKIRHFYHNRIDISSVAIDYRNNPVCISPPKHERNIPVASGVDRGATDGLQLVTPGPIIVIQNTVIVADKCGHLISWYRTEDLESIGYFHLETVETPVSMVIFSNALYVCYSYILAQYKITFSLTSAGHISSIDPQDLIKIPNISCVASKGNYLYVGTLKPSIILMGREHFLSKSEEYRLDLKRYENKSTYPWLQDMKALECCIVCLFTGSPSPLQMFTLEGELIRSIITEDKLSAAFHFNVFINIDTRDLEIYITDFWENIIKVFDMDGELLDTYLGKGTELCQLIHPTGIFVEPSGYLNICDMKEDNCLQRL